MRIKQFSEEVLFTADQVVKVGRGEIEFLKKRAACNGRKRIRLCTHKDIDDKLHEMLIVHTKDTYVRPHKHPNKSESFHLIEGSADVVIFNEAGNVVEVIQMGDYLSGCRFYYRISNPYYHTLLIRSEVLVFHETTNGPFKGSDTVYAPWSPEENDSVAVKKFVEQLARAVERFYPYVNNILEKRTS